MDEYNTRTLVPASGPGIAIGGGMCPGGGMPQPGIPQPQPGPHAGGPGAMDASNCGCAWEPPSTMNGVKLATLQSMYRNCN